MFIISAEQFLDEIKSETPNSINTADITKPNVVERVEMENHTYDKFRKPSGEPNTPKEVKSVIGALAVETNHQEVTDAFPVSLQTVGELARNDHANAEVAERKDNIIEKIKARGLEKIEKCVEFLDVSKDMKNSELIMVAEGLSRVHERLTPKDMVLDNRTQFIYYVPEKQNKIADYETIDV